MSTDTSEDRRERAVNALLNGIAVMLDPKEHGPADRAEVEATRLAAQGALTLFAMMSEDLHAMAVALKSIERDTTAAAVFVHGDSIALRPEAASDDVIVRRTQHIAEGVVEAVYRSWVAEGALVLSTGTVRDRILAGLRQAFEGKA